jgi:hypothetical protein
MKRFVILAGISVFAATTLADPYTSAKSQAKRAVSQTQARQAETMGAQPATTPPPQTAPAQPSPALVAMQLNVSNIAADLESLQKDPLKKQPLINDLHAAAQGTSPSKGSVSKLTDDLAATLPGKTTLSPEQRTKLAQYLRAVFNASHVAPAQQRTILDDAQKILQTAGVSAEDATKVIYDFKAIAAETK